MAAIANSSKHAYVYNHVIYQQLVTDADHIDIKSIESTASVKDFIAGAFNYQPGWMTFLYRVRKVFVRFLGMRQDGIPQPLHLTSDSLDLRVAHHIGFFEIEAFKPDDYLVVSAEESHLRAGLALFCEPLDSATNRYYAVTIVHYKSWAGPIYFNVIRPFHHAVVRQMLHAGGSH